jgi:hypothetical protein
MAPHLIVCISAFAAINCDFFSGHGFDPQNADTDPASGPVKLTLTPEAGSDIAPGQTVSLSLDVDVDDKYFRGFMIQVRDVAAEDNQIGNFEIEGSNDLVSHMTCGKGIHNSITHRTSDEKKSIKAEWKAPDDFEGEVYFKDVN